MKNGPIIIIDDDMEDKENFGDALNDLHVQNELLWFVNTSLAWDYLATTSDHPLIIFCDINLPTQNGMDFKKQIDDDKYLRKKSIPFVFFTTTIKQEAVNEAYTKMTVQGFFQKPVKYDEL